MNIQSILSVSIQLLFKNIYISSAFLKDLNIESLKVKLKIKKLNCRRYSQRYRWTNIQIWAQIDLVIYLERGIDCRLQRGGSKYRIPNKSSCELHEEIAHAFLVVVVVACLTCYAFVCVMLVIVGVFVCCCCVLLLLLLFMVQT